MRGLPSVWTWSDRRETSRRVDKATRHQRRIVPASVSSAISTCVAREAVRAWTSLLGDPGVPWSYESKRVGVEIIPQTWISCCRPVARPRE